MNWKDILERAGSSAVQQFIAVVVAAGSITKLAGLPWEVALATAAGAALASLLMTLVQLNVVSPLSFWPDLLLRVAKTFAASLLGALGSSAINVLSFNWVAALNIAAIAAVLSFAKGFLGPNTNSPSLVRGGVS